MDFSSNMMRNKPDDALAIGWGQDSASVSQTVGQPVDPEPSVRVQHHFDDVRFFEPGGDAGPKCSAQHACAAGRRLGVER